MTFRFTATGAMILLLAGSLWAAMTSIVPVTGGTESMHGASALKFALTSSSERFALAPSINQTITEQSTGPEGKRIVIETGPGSAQSRTARPHEQHLRPTPFLNFTHESIHNIAIPKKQHGHRPFQNYEELVDTMIPHKITGIPMIPAHAVLRNGKGDCTEHAVLLAALLRRDKIPARAIYGMILMKKYEGVSNVFVFHMWVEAWDGNSWLLLDATRPGSKNYSAYISLGEHRLMSASDRRFLRSAMTIENMTITLLEK